MPPPAEGLAPRLFLGPALRTQPDRRLVTLVREGYESAFEEIVRRYGRPLGRYAASIVGGRSEDVLQDAFAKALPALQRDDAEIDLRPWLFRVVRNTALNDLRDSPPSPELLAETLAGGRNPAEELEQREQLADLMKRLQELPEPQRAAIVMRELEGLGHDEIAAALGLTDGGARQAIYRARRALRDGVGMLLPLPFVRMLIDHGAETAAGAGAGGALAAAGASAGGAGAGGALKVGVVAAVLAGSVGAGVAVQGHRDGGPEAARASAAAPDPQPSARATPTQPTAEAISANHSRSSRRGEDQRGSGHKDGEPGRGHGGPGPSDARGNDRHNGPRPAQRGERHEGRRRDGPRGEHRGGRHGGHPEDDLGRHEGEPGPDRHGGRSGPGRGGGDGERISDDRHGGSGDGGEDPSGSGGNGGDGEIRSGGGPGPSPPPPPPEELEQESSAGEEPRDLEE